MPKTKRPFGVEVSTPSMEAHEVDPERTELIEGIDQLTQAPREYMMVNEVAINGLVRALKDKTNILGIRVYAEQVVVRSRK